MAAMILDPLLAPALQMAERPVLPERREADRIAHALTDLAERIMAMAHGEGDAQSAQQLTNCAEAMAVTVISLTMYARGVVPAIRSKPAGPTIIT